MNMILKNDFSNVKYYGRGPFENYWKGMSGSLTGIYSATVSDLKFEYARPQENGYHTDIRWLEIKDNNGIGIKITGSPYFCFSAHHNPISDYDEGVTKTFKNTFEVKEKPMVELNIDYKQTGVGGDTSWGAKPYKQYTLWPGSYSYSYRIEPIIQ